MSKQRSHPTDLGFLQAMPFPLQSLELSRTSSCLGSGISHKYFFKDFWEEERCVLSASYPPEPLASSLIYLMHLEGTHWGVSCLLQENQEWSRARLDDNCPLPE